MDVYRKIVRNKHHVRVTNAKVDIPININTIYVKKTL